VAEVITLTIVCTACLEGLALVLPDKGQVTELPDHDCPVDREAA
jgi:hypothetical protein